MRIALPDPDTLNTLGEHMRTKRVDLGLRQRDVAAQLAVNVNTVTNWEKHHRSPMLHLITRVAAFLGYDPILGDADSLSLGERVVRALKRLRMTQKDLARWLGVNPSALAR